MDLWSDGGGGLLTSLRLPADLSDRQRIPQRQRVEVLLGASTGRAGRKPGCKHWKSTRASLPERLISKQSAMVVCD